MGAATLYWRCLPERPEPYWGDLPSGALDVAAWEDGIHRLLGRSVPAGSGCRARLAAALGLPAAPAMPVQEGRHG